MDFVQPASRKTGSQIWQRIGQIRQAEGWLQLGTPKFSWGRTKMEEELCRQFARTLPPNLDSQCKFSAEPGGNYKMLIALHLCWIAGFAATHKTVGIARDRKIFPAGAAHALCRSCGKRGNCEHTFTLREVARPASTRTLVFQLTILV